MKEKPSRAEIKAADEFVDAVIAQIEIAGFSPLTMLRLWMRITRSVLTLKITRPAALCDSVASIAEDVLAEARDGRA